MQLASMAMDPKKRFDFRQVLAVVAAQAVAVRLNGLVKLPQGVEGDVARNVASSILQGASKMHLARSLLSQSA